MAGFFRDFSRRNRHGVSKDEPEKKRFFLFFELVWRKLWQLIGLNIIYFIVILPLLSYLIIIVIQSVGLTAADIEESSIFLAFGLVLNMPPAIAWPLIALSAVFYGPATCGLTYILRNYAREEHAWTFSDFFSRAKANFRQGFFTGVIDIVLLISCSMYLSMNMLEIGAGDWYLIIFKYIALIVFAVYIIMRFYIYTLIVTFDIKFKAIIKNAWIFVVLGFGRNLFSVVFILLTLFISMMMPLEFFALISLSMIRFIAVFNGYPVIDRYMLKPIRDKAEENPDDAPVFSDRPYDE